MGTQIIKQRHFDSTRVIPAQAGISLRSVVLFETGLERKDRKGNAKFRKGNYCHSEKRSDEESINIIRNTESTEKTQSSQRHQLSF